MQMGERFHSSVILLPIRFVYVQRLHLRRALNVGLILQQLLNSQQDLLYRYVRLPVLFIIQNR